jgi:hypothetical protein
VNKSQEALISDDDSDEEIFDTDEKNLSKSSKKYEHTTSKKFSRRTSQSTTFRGKNIEHKNVEEKHLSPSSQLIILTFDFSTNSFSTFFFFVKENQRHQLTHLNKVFPFGKLLSLSLVL